jgi:transcriptional regulator with XRE-family HTH domain
MTMNKLAYILQEINVSAFARSIGMNESLLRKYTNGIATPSEKQLKRIESAIRELGKRLKIVKLYNIK